MGGSSRFQKEVEALRRNVIAEATLMTFAERGCFSTSVKEIAERAGVATGTVYSHHASKDELLEASMAEAVQQAVERWSSVRELPDLRSALLFLTDEFLSALEGNSFLLPLVDGRLACSLHWSGRAKHLNDGIEELLVTTLKQAEATGQVASGTDLRLVAQLFLSIFSLPRTKERLRNEERATLADELVNNLLYGLRLT